MTTYQRWKRSLKSSPLSADERSQIENDLMKSGKSFEEIAEKYNLFKNDVRKIAEEMGLLQKENEEEVPVTIVTTEANEPEVIKVKKKRVHLTDDDKIKIGEDLESYQNSGWKDFTRDSFMQKHNISEATLYRISGAFGIKLPRTKDLVVEEATPVKGEETITFDENFDPAETSEDPADTPYISPITDEEIEPLDNHINTRVISVRLDSTVFISGINYCIFNNENLTQAVIEDKIGKFFRSCVVGKGAIEVKVYLNTPTMDILIGSTLVKYAYMFQVNLSYMILGKEKKVVDCFGNQELGENLNWLVSKYNAFKGLYKLSFDNLINLDSVYYLYLSYRGKNSIIVTDEYDRAIELFARYMIEAKLDGKTIFKGSVKRLCKGVQTDLINFTNDKIY